MKESITSDDILGKKAVDAVGGILGIVTKLHIDNSKKKILGITIDQGFMKPDLFMGTEYIKYFGVDAVLLNDFPLDRLKGMRVITESGKVLGYVVSVEKDGNTLKGINFRKRMSKAANIPLSEIKEIGGSVIVKG